MSRLAAVFSFRYDAELVPDLLKNLEDVVDEVISHDDRENPGLWYHEGVVRRSLIERARRCGADWVLCMDPDERLEKRAGEVIRQLIRRRGKIIYGFALREMWCEGYYRVDGVWGEKRQYRLFPLLEGQEFRDTPIHAGWAPVNTDYCCCDLDLNLYHLKMMHPRNRVLRRNLYEALDPESAFQEMGYEYLVNEDGLILEKIPACREFVPAISGLYVMQLGREPSVLIGDGGPVPEHSWTAEGLQPVMGKWEWRYRNSAPFPYADTPSYAKATEFLRGHGLVEDWGCGAAWARRFFEEYRGVDGSAGHADLVCDLRKYRSRVPCILMRHVLEHNLEWERVLRNALQSFEKRMVLVIFTPFGETTHQIASHWDGIPDISFNRQELVRHFAGLTYSEESFPSSTVYGKEHIFYLRPGEPLTVDLPLLEELADHRDYNLEQFGETVEPLGKSPIRLPRSSMITLSGWAVDRSARVWAGGVDVEVDGAFHATRYGGERPDVSDFFGEPLYRYCGFSFGVAAAQFDCGPHSLRLRIVSADRKSYRCTAAFRFELE
jgi:hypothetical protein